MKKLINLLSVITGFIVLGFILLVIASPARSNTDNLMLGMIAFIVSQSAYEYNGEPLPEIVIKSREEMCTDLFTKEQLDAMNEPCNAAGYYNNTTNTIYVTDIPVAFMVEERYIEVVIFHELVHFLQYSGGWDKVVECRNQLEFDAYLLQAMFIETMGWPEQNKPDPLFALVISSCPGQWGSSR